LFPSREDVVKMALDATECPIERPLDWLTQRQYYSGKKKRHTIKYEVGVHLSTGRIIWLVGGIPGSVHDVKIAASNGIVDQILNGEWILADKGYTDSELPFLTPFKNPQTDEEVQWNSYINQARAIVENTYGRIKSFGCVKSIWRHDLELHPIAFKAVCILVNMDLDVHPLRNR
jgi:hypothetical protein